jgi:hypothetical protein
MIDFKIMPIFKNTFFFDGTKLLETSLTEESAGNPEGLDLEKFEKKIVNMIQKEVNREIQTKNVGNYHLSLISRQITFPGKSGISKPLILYVICDSTINNQKLKTYMNELMNLFTTRFSRNTIFDKKLNKFQSFNNHFEKTYERVFNQGFTDKIKSFFT